MRLDMTCMEFLYYCIILLNIMSPKMIYYSFAFNKDIFLFLLCICFAFSSVYFQLFSQVGFAPLTFVLIG